jgi:class 3 adenylate cyclase
MDAASLAGFALVSSCLLGLAWQAHLQARSLNAHRRQAVRESSRLKDHNERLARYLPDALTPAIRDAPAALQPPKEVFVTVAFVDLVGFAELVASHSVSEVVDVLNDFMTMTSQLTARHGGVLGKFLGDGVLIYFAEVPEGGQGTPDASARVRAAAGCARLALTLSPELLALSRAWQQRGLGLRLTSRTGIASGYCALGDWGGRDRLDYTLIGTPVNLASRLQSAAEPGSALLSSTTAALIGQSPHLTGHLGEPRDLEVRGLGRVVVHELNGSAKVRAIPLPVRTGKPDV